VSGAVSLGSYEAGVLYEVLYAISQHNQNAATTVDEKIYVDVLTGASAGGMSVALAAQKLLYDADALHDPYNNALYQAWVVDIDLNGLLRLGPKEPTNCSIFSSDLIADFVSQYLRSRYESGPVPPAKIHAAVSPAQSIRVGLALTNLNGIDYGRNTLTDGRFIYSRFQDELCSTVTPGDDNEVAWKRIADAAVACGAFPFAFRAQDLQRMRAEFTDPDIVQANLSADPLQFTYTDGGLFQNEPLGMAKNFVDELDNHLNSDSRAYLFISPEPKASTANRVFSAKAATFRGMFSRLAPDILYQARFQDWVTAEEVNESVDIFNGRAMALQVLMAERTLTPETLNGVCDILLTQFFHSDCDLEAARDQLRKQFNAEYEDLEQRTDTETAKAWIDAILILEVAADLHTKDEMYIYTVTAAAEELAGAQLDSFLGFLDQSFRDHDYDIGRTKAQNFLTNTVATQKGPLTALRYTPLPIRPIDAKLAGLKIQNAPLAKRKALRDQLNNRADIVLKEFGVPLALRAPLRWFYLNTKINGYLEL
jgi:hypothetical protein